MGFIAVLIGIMLIIFSVLFFVGTLCYSMQFLCWLFGYCYGTGDIVIITDVTCGELTTKRGYVLQNNNRFWNEGSMRCAVYNAGEIKVKSFHNFDLYRIKKASFKDKSRKMGEIYEYIKTNEFKQFAERGFECNDLEENK